MKTAFFFAGIFLVSALSLFLCSFKDYSVEKVDNLLRQIVVRQEKQIIPTLLDYGRNTSADAGHSLHYYASLYIVYKLYPKEFLLLKNRKNCSETIDYVIEFGEQYFENYYPEMSLDDVVKCMKDDLPPFRQKDPAGQAGNPASAAGRIKS